MPWDLNISQSQLNNRVFLKNLLKKILSKEHFILSKKVEKFAQRSLQPNLILIHVN